MVALLPEREHQQERGGLRVGEQPFEELQRGGVRPVQILQRDGDRPVLREPLQPVPHDLERPVLERLRRELAQASLRIRLEGEPEHRGEVRGELGGAIAEEPLDVATERDPHPHLRLVREDTEPRADEVAERPVRHRLAVGDALPLEPTGAAARRLALVEHAPGTPRGASSCRSRARRS